MTGIMAQSGALSLLWTALLACALGLVDARTLRGRYVELTLSAGDECDVSAPPYSAKADGRANATGAIQAALDNCTGPVLIPAGKRFLVAALRIGRSHTELRIEGELLVSDDIEKFPAGGHVISARGVSDIAITGGGLVDGQGLAWWREMKKPGKKEMWRPHLVDFSHVDRAILRDTTYKNGPNHILELGCNHCELAGISVLNPPSTGECEKADECSHNTDAVDVHGDPFYVHSVNFSTGDDNVAGHANNTLVEDSFFGTGHGASIGSLCDDWLTNITFRNITFSGTTAGARIKSHPGCAGRVWDVTYEQLRLDGVENVIRLDQFYFAPPHPKPSTMQFEVKFKDIVATNSGVPGQDGKDAVIFNCDTVEKESGGANCRVTLDSIDMVPAKKGDKPIKMECAGTRGVLHDVTGLTNCLMD